jgi:hypothetical protein
MAKPVHLDIVTGVAARVELFSESAPPTATKTSRGKAPTPGRAVNVMRLHLRDVATGKDKEFVIRNSTVGVHDQHRVTIIRAKQNRTKDLKIVAVINQSTGQWEDRRAMIEMVSTPNPVFGPLWKAGFASAALAAIVFAVNHFIFVEDGTGLGGSLWYGFLWGFITYPILWAMFRVWNGLTRKRRARLAKELLRAEIDHQVAIASAMATVKEG